MRFKSILSLLVILFAMTLIGGNGISQEEKKSETVVCPVSGETVLKSEAAGPYKYEGVDYYFCCNNCLNKFKENPQKYINKTTTLCCDGKMTGDKATAIKVTYEGKDYFFCSEKCKAEFDKDPKAYLQRVKADKSGSKCGAKSGKCCGSSNKI